MCKMSTSLDRTLVALKETVYTLDDQKMLIRSLECLRDTVGNQNIKATIVNSVNSLILYKDTKGYDSSTEALMDIPKLHTVIYGCPGTGKTLLAKILASIWTSIGLIKTTSKEQPQVQQSTYLGTKFPQSTIFKLGIPDMAIMAIIGFCVYKLVQLLWTRMNMSKLLALEGKEELVVQLLLVAGLLFVLTYLTILTQKKYSSWSSRESAVKETVRSNVTSDRERDDSSIDGHGEVDVRESFFEKYSDVLSGDRVVIASPADFIGQYLGFTSEKTRNFLKSSLGKVVFVDEAYGFIPRKDHMYGREALNEITSFIDANHGKIVLIFAGYEDMLRRGVFEVQKGLDRRFGMHITCTGYTLPELFQMLKNKLTTRGMTLTNEDMCFEEFSKGRFTYFAGDIDVLSDYLREPLAEAYVVNKANAFSIDKVAAEQKSCTDSGLGDDSMDLTSDGSSLDTGSDTSEECEYISNEGYSGTKSGERFFKNLIQNSLMVSPQIMKDAVNKLNSRRSATEKTSTPDPNNLVRLLFGNS